MYMKRILLSCCLACLLMAGTTASAQTAPYAVSPAVAELYSRLTALPAVQKGLDFIKADHADTVAEQKQICEIPAPPFKEQVRAADFQKRLAALGLKDVQMDKEGNVFGLRPGAGNGPKLLVAAHLDTVFAAGTDVKVKEKDGKLYAPGIADDARGLAALLGVIRAFNATGIKTVGDIIFCGNVGEEGLGDLRGVKALFRDNKDIDGFISIDGADLNRITYLATGSHRYEVTFSGPGGHSFSAFGRPSAIHAMGRAIAQIADLTTPAEPQDHLYRRCGQRRHFGKLDCGGGKTADGYALEPGQGAPGDRGQVLRCPEEGGCRGKRPLEERQDHGPDQAGG